MKGVIWIKAMEVICFLTRGLRQCACFSAKGKNKETLFQILCKGRLIFLWKMLPPFGLMKLQARLMCICEEYHHHWNYVGDVKLFVCLDYTLSKVVLKRSVMSYTEKKDMLIKVASKSTPSQIHFFFFLFLSFKMRSSPSPFVQIRFIVGVCWFNAWLKSLRERSVVTEDNPLDMQWTSTVVFVSFKFTWIASD